MNVIVDKKIFSEIIQRLEKVTGKQLNLDVLKCVYMETTKKELILRATNLDIGVQVSVPVKIKKEGGVAVAATALNAFLTNTESPDIHLTVKKSTLLVEAGNLSATMNTTQKDEFPTFPTVSGKKMSLSPKHMIKGLRAVWYAASTSNMKPELASVLVKGGNSEFVCVATDSFRLAEKKVQSEGVESLPNILIPLKNVGEIIRNLETAISVVEVTASDNQLSLAFDGTHITSRLIDGSFPDYEQIIPKEHTTEVVVLKQDLIGALKATNVFANKFNQATINVNSKTKSVTIHTTGGETGDATATLDAAVTGEDIEANFNQKYITDSFQSIPEDSVMLRFFGKGKPMVIRGVSDPSFLYLTMPMNR